MSRTGLLGGSFNPAHEGHRRITINAAEALGLDESWWLVSPGNPLKAEAGMAPLEARFASARLASHGLPVRVTAIERELDTRFAVDTLRALLRRYPRRRFIWMMGADNLAQFHRWKDWREIAALVPIAVIGRPGYDALAEAAPAMAWLRRFVQPAASAHEWTEWSTPSIVLLRLPPDPSSATAIRAADPDWHQRLAESFNHKALRDAVTRRPI
jgi:nicotinate-nucleotide adenylyltransferase